MVSKKDREDYEEGVRDREKGAVEQVITDVSGDHPGTEPYYKARKGEELDEDKQDKEE
jgi:hypothetical protein